MLNMHLEVRNQLRESCGEDKCRDFYKIRDDIFVLHLDILNHGLFEPCCMIYMYLY